MNASSYFFLSYAHLPPMQGVDADPDNDVQRFFADLSRVLRPLVGVGEGETVGFLDTELPPGADWKEARSRALGVVQVLVPLYSPAYFRNAWTLSERESFQGRIKAVPAPVARRRIKPVLWVPLPPWESRDETQDALAIAPGVDSYRDDGLRVLSRFSMYRDDYRTILGRLAQEIADVSTQHELAPSPAPPATPDPIPRELAQFVVVVAAPDLAEVPDGRNPASYGTDPTQWRPFHDDEAVPLAAYAANTAERLNLATYVTDLDQIGDLLDGRPGVVLLDPWILVGDRPERTLEAKLRGLPPWVPVVVAVDPADAGDAARADELTGQVDDMLRAMPRAASKQLRGPAELSWGMPRLINEARHQFLKQGLAATDPGPPRPRLKHGNPPITDTVRGRLDEH